VLSVLLGVLRLTICIGFAISGGVDSMALAALYTEAQSANNLLPKPHGFIVDHRVRPESTEEAEWVAQQLRSKRRIYDSSATFRC
jgi:tRNA(Ile)-lysidine synthase TilS/MesJ